MNVLRNKTLLFAEDEPELLEIYSHWFERLGYEVLVAGNGKEALSLCRNHAVDLVISDVRMPHGDGVELARTLKESMGKSPLLVFLTGFADISNEEAYDLGACTILSKPIQRGELEAAVARFLKPARELWAAPPAVTPKMVVEKYFDSLESALEQKTLSLGRGGMFVRGPELLAKDDPIGFQFRFDGGSAERIEGSGILRWQRVSTQHGLPAGVGIEILHLAAQALEPVIEWIARVRPRAFIPKE